ncbi:hypothetical protein KFU94_28560 [Chloroflexi bacterium TSY]|nr:hypothetical protein [Chloroflexi bacterium TSY]
MACISPPELDQIDLLMLLDHEADDAVIQHVQQCTHCRSNAERLAHLDNRTFQHLHRVTCPEPDDLRDYHYGFTMPEQTTAITQHLETCPHCTRELTTLSAFVGEFEKIGEVVEIGTPTAETEPPLLDKVRVVVAELLQGGSGLTPAFNVRGHDESLVYQAEGVQISIQIQEDIEHPGHKMLSGLIVGVNAPEFEVQLRLEGRTIVQTSVDDLGIFALSQLSPNEYELIIIGPEFQIQIQALSV